MALRSCFVSFKDSRGIHHGVEVEAESLYDAAVKGVCRLTENPWIERIAPGTVLTIESREARTQHSVTLQQVEQWLASTSRSPSEASKKTKLKLLLLQR